ncbi:MAG: universal stress protein [Planctomycetaceae bacterium]|nr:universal stress protein [Planctomycetaceae bacterium]
MTWLKDRIVLVPTDMSEFSLRAFEVAGQLVSDRRLIRVLHVLPIIDAIAPETAWVTIDETSRLEQVKKLVGEFLEQHQCGDLSFEVLPGNAGHEIANYAKEIEAGLIVIPSQGRGMLHRLLLGSTTDRVVRLSHCPVLVLKEEKKEAGR